jgi:hypothetical protein
MYKWSITTLLLVATLVSCPSPTGTITSVSVSANPISVNTNASSAISATVTGTGGFSQAVSWSIVSGGGTLNLSGAGATFIAPNTASSTVIKATSTQDSSKSGTVTVITNTINPNSSISSVSITPPASSTLNAGASVNLTSNVTGTGAFNTAVTWSKISGTGMLSNQANTSATFTAVTQATSSVTVIRATSVQDSSKFNELTLNTNAQAVGDTTPPKINVTEAINSTTVHVTFNEALAANSIVTDQFRIGLPTNLTVTNAVLSASDPKIVILTTATQVKNESYTVLVNNVAAATKVTDLAGNQHLPGDSVTSFSATFTGK